MAQYVQFHNMGFFEKIADGQQCYKVPGNFYQMEEASTANGKYISLASNMLLVPDDL